MAKVIGSWWRVPPLRECRGHSKDWYARVLGMEPDEIGGFHFMHGESAAGLRRRRAHDLRDLRGRRPIISRPRTLPFMLNLMVDDLDGVLARA
jgi:hypothetical protein